MTPFATHVSADIRISVQSFFVPEQSSQEEQTYVFAYRITITNESSITVQLLRRHWEIRDGGAERRTVQGEGVVGQQPVLRAGQTHSYMSGSVIKTPIGCMGGSYTFRRLDTDETFEAQIPEFLLMAPFLLN
jgi:ApaG protein